MEISVVFPAPLGPSTAVTCPASAVNDTPSTATMWSYRTVSSLTSTAVTLPDAIRLSHESRAGGQVACTP